MLKQIIIIAVQFLVLLSSTQQKPYDYYLFASEMPGTVCMTQNCQIDMIQNLNATSTNIHGLWPNNFDGSNPFNCDTSNEYKDQLIKKDVLNNLNSNMVGLYNSTYWFRYHEWGKHGSCFQKPNKQKSGKFLKNVNENFDEHMTNYFETILTLKKKQNLPEILFNHQYKINELEYEQTLQNLQNNFSSHLNGIKSFSLQCFVDKKTQKQYLQNIFVCYDLNIEPIDCPKSLINVPYTQNTCKESSNIFTKLLQLQNQQ